MTLASREINATNGLFSGVSRAGLLRRARAEFLDTRTYRRGKEISRSSYVQAFTRLCYRYLAGKAGLFDAVGHFNITIKHADDTEWFLRANERGAVMKLLPAVLLYRRLHYINFSRIKDSNSRDTFTRLVKTPLERPAL